MSSLTDCKFVINLVNKALLYKCHNTKDALSNINYKHFTTRKFMTDNRYF
jgi:hypothetical protein